MLTIFRTTIVLTLTITFLASVGWAQDATSEAAEPTLLSGFFGLDNALPVQANRLCRRARAQDGMPVIFSTVIDPKTLQAEDFAVITAAGVVQTPTCATLSPAVDAGELRTALLVGEFGDAQTDPPVRVEVVGDILTGGASPASFLGAEVAVTPLSAGPSIIVAERVPPTQWRLDQASGSQRGSGCPSADTLQAVRVTWAGGVTTVAGEEAGEAERVRYRVTLRSPGGEEMNVAPFALADLGDNDNNHLLCLDVRGDPLTVFLPAGRLVDPNRDAPNPETRAVVRLEPTSAPMRTRNVRYCEVVPTYRQGLTLHTEIWNTLGLNDCPADAWVALDAERLQDELGAVNVSLNGPRYWVVDEISALGSVTAAGNRTSFGGIEMEQRAVLETRLRSDLIGSQLYTPNTVQRDTRYVFYAGEFIYILKGASGDVYVMQSYSQIVDPDLTPAKLNELGTSLALPEGWRYEVVLLQEDLILISDGMTTVVNDDFLNTYQLADKALLP